MKEVHEILIWGKTYPELSSKYGETVCTGGVLEDGRPVRLYPIPFRFLEGDQKFKKYDVIRATLTKAKSDHRPESMRLDPDTIEVLGNIGPDNRGWMRRSQKMFKNPLWQFADYDDLMAAHKVRGTSIGVVRPLEITNVTLEERRDEGRESFEQKTRKIHDKKQQEYLFETMALQTGKLDYIPARPVIEWRCASSRCGTANGHKKHSMQVLDWETIQLLRKKGEFDVVDMLLRILNAEEYDTKLFLGNFRTHPDRFGIVGFWYPKRQIVKEGETLDLFGEAQG